VGDAPVAPALVGSRVLPGVGNGVSSRGLIAERAGIGVVSRARISEVIALMTEILFIVQT